jgi:hypothetical protein
MLESRGHMLIVDVDIGIVVVMTAVDAMVD